MHICFEEKKLKTSFRKMNFTDIIPLKRMVPAKEFAFHDDIKLNSFKMIDGAKGDDSLPLIEIFKGQR
jgi:hypothetical protein